MRSRGYATFRHSLADAIKTTALYITLQRTMYIPQNDVIFHFNSVTTMKNFRSIYVHILYFSFILMLFFNANIELQFVQVILFHRRIIVVTRCYM